MSEAIHSSNFRIGVLLFGMGPSGQLLLLKRSKQPNRGLWCAAGGKLEMELGESPYECAAREAKEEIGINLKAKDLELRCVLSEKDYEGLGHWLMFVFTIGKVIETLPDTIEEGEFAFISKDKLANVSMPELDRRILVERILNEEGAKLSWIAVQGGSLSVDESIVVEEELF